MTTNNELLPCPFCGSDDLTFVDDSQTAHVHCRACCASGPTVIGGSGTSSAWWSQRHCQPAMPADADPLQPATDWLFEATEGLTAGDIQRILRIGHNRASRMLDAARRRIEEE